MSLSPQVDLSGDRNCNCLGDDSRPQQFFLSHKSLEMRRKPPVQTRQREEQIVSVENAGKRSLKKASRPVYMATSTPKRVDPMQEYYTQKKVVGKQREEERRTVGVDQRRSIPHINLQRKEGRGEVRHFESFQRKNSSRLEEAGRNGQIINTPLSPQRLLLSPSHSPSPETQIRINFTHSPPPIIVQKHFPSPTTREFTHFQHETRRFPHLSQLKEEMHIVIAPIPSPREHPSSQKTGNEDFIEFQLAEDSADTSRIMPRRQRLLSPEQSHRKGSFTQSEYFKFGETFKSRIDNPIPNNKRDPHNPHKSRIQTSKSRIDPKRSTVGETGKSKVRSGRQQKKSLKKIQDVEEIRSMVDSDQASDQDKQSVVLGRLHEYGSMLDPSLSITTPSLQSKLVSLNTQSSTIGKSFLRPFELSIERTHFR